MQLSPWRLFNVLAYRAVTDNMPRFVAFHVRLSVWVFSACSVYKGFFPHNVKKTLLILFKRTPKLYLSDIQEHKFTQHNMHKHLLKTQKNNINYVWTPFHSLCPSHRGLESWFLGDLGLRKLDKCFKMSKVRLFNDLKRKCSNRVLEKCFFFYKSLWSKFSFFSLAVIFSNFWMELRRKPLSIRQGNKFA